MEVKHGKCLSFKAKEIRKHRINQIPPQHVLQEMLMKELKNHMATASEDAKQQTGRLIELLTQRAADKSYLIDYLARLHDITAVAIFDPEYRYSINPERIKPIMS